MGAEEEDRHGRGIRLCGTRLNLRSFDERGIRITISKEPAEAVWKDVAATLDREAKPVVKLVQALEG